MHASHFLVHGLLPAAMLLGAAPAQQPDAHDAPHAPMAPLSFTGIEASTTDAAPAKLVPGAGQPLRPEHFLVPIHTQPDDPDGGAYGTWAAAMTYKVSFHDGYAFYPYLGADYPRNLPLRWQTRAVSAGGRPVLTEGTSAVHRHTDWRYEYHWPGMVEAYDVRVDGVEQTFTFAAPLGAGDLVVEGAIETELEATALEDQHAAITFRDHAGKPILSYGAAFVLDAAGRKAPIATRFDGRTIRLTVPESWLRQATWPVTIDPLTTRTSVATWGASTFGLVSYPEVGRDDEATSDNVMVFYARQSSASDFDGYARLVNDDLSGTSLVYTDVTASWSTVRAGVCFVGGASRWALCLQRDFTSNSGVRVYTHASANVTLNSGTTIFLPIPAGETNRYPQIGGTAGFSTGNHALLVYQADVTATQANTANSDIWAHMIDVAAGTFQPRFALGSTANNFDQEYPDVNQVSDGGTASWIVGWQEFDNNITGDDWDIIIARVTSTGSVGGTSFVGPAGGAPLHKRRVQIEGRGGRYMASMIRDDAGNGDTGSEIMAHRFDWADTAASPSKKQMKTVVSDTVNQNFVNGGIAYDSNSRSHWAIVYQRGGFSTGDVFVRRLAYKCGTTESATVYSSPNGAWSPQVTFNDDANEFILVYGSNDNAPTGLPVYGQRLQYPSTATNVLFGTGCGPGTISATTPYAGSEFFTVRLSGVAASQPAILATSLGSGGFPLDFLGMNGCVFNLDAGAAFLFTLGTTTSASGGAQMTFALPDDPALTGNLYLQWVHRQPGLNPAGFGATQGLRSQIR